MAKAKKSKNEEQKGDNSEALVKHQKLCLSIDMENRRIYGFTELEVVVPENGIVGLHADNLAIDSVMVDGEPAKFEVFPHFSHLDSEDRWCSVSTTTSAADAAGSSYILALERELVPNLLIMCSQTSNSEGEQLDVVPENGEQPTMETKQNVKVIRIDYWVEKAETGIHLDGNVLHTNNQIRRARCWFPCMDNNMQSCCYDLEFTVAHNYVAVSTGALLYQVWSKDDPPRKTYVYKLNVPVAARWISLVVAPFEILPDRHSSFLSHMCLPGDLPKLRNTMSFFHGAFSYYEDYLSAKFPFGSYTQVFIAPEMAISSLSLGASMSIFSSHVLFGEKVIDQTIETRIKLAHALARQWFGVYITPEGPSDEWLLDGLAWFLTDLFIKRSLGNNEARFRRYKANCAVCRTDDSGATALSSSSSSKDLYGTECIGFYGKIRSWKSVAILQMLEKQMGPEPFCKILQIIVSRGREATHPMRNLSTKEFRQLANKVGNLERPFLKEFFPRWVGSCGCPVLKMGFSYNKRKNLFELAVLRGCTSRPDSRVSISGRNNESDSHEGDDGWPGMMSIRVHELDGMYDHPILPMAGEPWQILEIQCHSRLASKRFQKPKKGTKPDGSDDNGDTLPAPEMRSNSDSPLLWLRADPEMEYLAEIRFIQPVQMWINQLEKDKDVVAQTQAISTLETLPQVSSAVINALNSFLTDSKAFWRVRIEAAFALASTASEETDWAGLFHLISFYKSRRYDPNIGLPKPNDFHDFQEYFVLEAIPHAIATVRAADEKSPREAVEFVLQLLKYNDNNGNPYSDVFWLAALVESVGELEFGQQSIVYLSSLLKRLDRVLQFDRLMPSHNGVLTLSCIRTLEQIALKFSEFIPLDQVTELIKPFRVTKTSWQIRIEACRALLDLEFQCKGIGSALMLFITYLDEETSIRGQVKLGVHALRLCQMSGKSDSANDIKSETLLALLRLLESPMSFNNVILRHYIFSILQALAGRTPTLHGVPRDETLRMGHTETYTIFAALVKQSKSPELPMATSGHEASTFLPPPGQADWNTENHEQPQDITGLVPEICPANGAIEPTLQQFNSAGEPLLVPETFEEVLTAENTEQRAILTNLPQDDALCGAAKSFDEVLAAAKSFGEELTAENNEQKNDLISHLQDSAIVSKEPPSEAGNLTEAPREVEGLTLPHASPHIDTTVKDEPMELLITHSQANSVIPETIVEADVRCNKPHDQGNVLSNVVPENSELAAPSREPDTVSNSQDRKKPIFRIKVKQSAASRRGDPDYAILNKSQDGHRDTDRGASSSMSVDAPQRNIMDTVSTSNQNVEEVNSCHDVGSRVTASIGSVKVAADADEIGKELQCTADSSKVTLPVPLADQATSNMRESDAEAHVLKYGTEQSSFSGREMDRGSLAANKPQGERKDKKKDKKRRRDEHKAKHNDPEYKEKKRLKKEKKRKEKELSKLLQEGVKGPPSEANMVERTNNLDITLASSRRVGTATSTRDLENKRTDAREGTVEVPSAEPKVPYYVNSKDNSLTRSSSLQQIHGESSGVKVVEKRVDANVSQSKPSNKVRIKIKKMS